MAKNSEDLHLSLYAFKALAEGLRSVDHIKGFTHGFYRYPGAFSPDFARAVIRVFTKPGDVVLDPFAGGGTSLVEASSMGRRSMGSDLNPLAVFISRVKTTPLSESSLSVVERWLETSLAELRVRDAPEVTQADWLAVRERWSNSSLTHSWPLWRTLATLRARLGLLANKKERDIAACLLLRVGQWAFDCRLVVPSSGSFKNKLRTTYVHMVEGMRSFRDSVAQAGQAYEFHRDLLPRCLSLPAQQLPFNKYVKSLAPPALILTSPPYPGVHMLYHRWQMMGRRESPAPYWLINSSDGNPASFYTFGHRYQKDLKNYFDNAGEAFSSIARLCDRGTTVIQLVAFAEPDLYLPRYLSMMQHAGFEELRLRRDDSKRGGRLSRQVPHRRFYADGLGHTPSSQEVLLIHCRR